MTGIDRRSFLRAAGAAGGATVLLGAGAARAAAPTPNPVLAPFLHGVASGDPLPTSVILWTRVDPAGAPGDIPLTWAVGTDPGLTAVVATGAGTARAGRDWCFKVDAGGLRPATTYYYRFEAQGRASITGRTKTAPEGAVDRLRFGVVSCSNLPNGFFNAYRTLSQREDLDAVLHLGDYLYESGNQSKVGRPADPPREILSLADYRQRYSQYRLDPDLRRLHQQYAFICVWDDHESTNDSWFGGADNHNPDEGEGDWFVRKNASAKAYDEWIPIRLPDQAGRSFEQATRIYRTFRYGDLADLIMLDTRLEGRSKQTGEDPSFDPATDDPTRSILGAAQETWFGDRLVESSAGGRRWRLVGQQVMFGQLNGVGLPDTPTTRFTRGGGITLNPDQWDGYTASRDRVFKVLAGDNPVSRTIVDTVVLTGDIHCSWAIDLTPDPYNPLVYVAATGAGSRAVEFVTPSITSTNFDDATGVPSDGLEVAVKAVNPHIKYTELDSNGYLVLDVTSNKVQSDWWFVDTVARPSRTEAFAAAWKTDAGSNRVTPASGPVANGPGAPPAPLAIGQDPDPIVPEVAVPALLPAAALAATGAAIALRRRRQPRPDPS